MKKPSSFTLIELLIVIVIIGILATTLIPKLNGLQDKAKYARVERDFSDFRTAVLWAQNNQQKNLKDITGVGRRAVNGRYDPDLCIADGVDMKKLAEDHYCRMIRYEVLRSIEQAAGYHSGDLAHMQKDPWGSPYIFSVGEGVTTPCDIAVRYNELQSPGPDGRARISYFVWRNLDSTDDKITTYRSIFCPDAY